MLFYGTYAGMVVGKAKRECGCCMANVDIRCYVIFQETFSKWTCRFIYKISLGREGLGEFVILNNKFRCFKFSIVDNEFYLFLRFGGFNMSMYNVGYDLFVYLIVLKHLILVVEVYSVSIVIIVIIIFVNVMEILFYLLID